MNTGLFKISELSGYCAQAAFRVLKLFYPYGPCFF